MSASWFIAQTETVDQTAVESATHWAVDVGFVLAVLVGAWLLTRIARVVAAVGVDQVARRARAGKSSRWRVRLPRRHTETDEVAELRRQHRVDATAKMISRLASVGVWFVAIIVLIDHFGVDVMLAVSGAGFLGLALAVGAQHSVHDCVTGLHVLLEDRYWVGDEIEVLTASGERVNGIVANVGVFATRIESGGSTWHIANRTLVEVCNLSQHGVPATIRVAAGTQDLGDDTIANATRDAFDDITAGHVIIDDVKVVDGSADAAGYEIALRTHRNLSGSERDRLAAMTQERIDSSGDAD